jgi:hypothetical protein
MPKTLQLLALATAALALAQPAAAITAETKAAAKGAAIGAAKTKATKVAKAALPAAAALPALTDSQLAMAERVHTGRTDCEFSQHVNVNPHASHKGAFTLGFKNSSYTMLPEDTTTGAVRLEDKKAGVVWIQIGNKSMLMNSKIGQRMVDNCVHEAQLAAAQAAGNAPAK